MMFREIISLLFAELRKATVTFVVSVCLSVRVEHFGYHWTVFTRVRISSPPIPEKVVKIQNSMKIGQE